MPVAEAQENFGVSHNAASSIFEVKTQRSDSSEFCSNNLIDLAFVGIATENIKVVFPCKGTRPVDHTIVIMGEASHFVLPAT